MRLTRILQLPARPQQLTLPAVLAACLLALILSGLPRPVELLAYDSMTRLAMDSSRQSPVVLVEIPATFTADGGQALTRLVARLEADGARRVMLFAPAQDLTTPSVATLAADPRFSWIRPLHREGGSARVWTPEPNPGLQEAGVAPPPVTLLGVARSVDLAVLTAQGAFPHAVALAAGLPAPPGGQLYINFNRGREAIPRVSAHQVQAGEIPSQLFRDRVVVLGLPLEAAAAGIDTPQSPARGALSLAEFQAMAISTALDDAAITVIDGLAAAALVVATYLVLSLLFMWLSAGAGMAAGFALAALLVAGSVLLLGIAHLYLPVVQVILAGVAAYAAAHVLHTRQQDAELSSLHARILNKIHARRFVPGLHESDYPWQQLVSMLNQHLALNRSIILAKVAGDHRVMEVASLNCGLDSIAERRRDFRRTPYSTALASSLPIELRKPYFVAAHPDELAFMVPLSFHGEVLGFWAYTVIPGEHFNRERFLDNTHVFAREIAELLWQREQWQDRKRREGTLLYRLLRRQPRRTTPTELTTSLARVESRLDTLEELFNGLTEAVVLYDLFGEIIQANQRMEAIARTAGLRLYDLSAADLLGALTGGDTDAARARLRHAVLQRKSVEIEATLPGTDTGFLLRIRALQHDHTDARIADSLQQPFALLGILIEFIDISATQERLAVARDLGDHLLEELSHEITRGSDPGRLTTLVGEARRVLDQGLRTSRADGLVDARRLLHRLLARQAERLARDRIQTELLLPARMPLVHGEAEQLERLLDNALQLLADDAPAGTVLSVSATRQDSRLTLLLSGNGFGIPQEKVDAVLDAPATPVMSSPLSHLRADRDRLREEGGDLVIRSTPGEGFRIEVSLRSFHLSKAAT